MKKIILIALLGVSHLMVAQVSQKLGDFTAVRAFDRISVTLMKSNENKIDIRGKQAGDVEVITKNGELKIRMKVSKMFNGEDIEATVYYTGIIDRVEASEGAVIGSSDTFSPVAMELNAKEGAQINLKIKVDKLKTKAGSGGIINVIGSAKNHDASMGTGGILKAKELETAQTAVSVSAGGEATISATDFVDAKTLAGGDIKIYGNPKQVSQKTRAGGNINIL